LSEMPLIETEKCDGCGLCVSVCTCGALSIVDNVISLVEGEDCGWCTQCELVCPNGVISFPFEIVTEEP